MCNFCDAIFFVGEGTWGVGHYHFEAKLPMMKDAEMTPLLPPRSQRRAKEKHQKDVNDPKQRANYGSGNNNERSSDSDSDSGSEDEDEDQDQDEYSEDGLHHHWRHPKPFNARSGELPVIHPLGVATRKPRWTGIRSKIAAVGDRFP